MSKQEPAALVAPCWFPACCWEGIAVASCSADRWELHVVGAGSFFLELFLLQKRAENSPAQQMFLEGCATAENS